MSSIIFIETDRLILRQWQATDCEPYIKMNLDKDVMEYFPSILSSEQSLLHINKMTEKIDQHGYGLFAVERKDTQSFIGFTGFSRPNFNAFFTPCVEIGWRMAKELWNQGFATEAANACLLFGFEKFKFEEIYSFTSIHNLNSERVMKKIGMKQVGKFDHPLLEKDHCLQKHILYKIEDKKH